MAGTILIAGMGPGNGMALAKRFGCEGFHIVMMARNSDRMKEMCEQLRADNIACNAYSCDFADEKSLRSALAKITTAHRQVDVVVYNASSLVYSNPSQINYDTFISDFKTNVAGALLIAQHFIPEMQERKSGTIIFTGGGTALQPWMPGASLSVGKAGIRSLAYTLAEECKPLGIHVTTITIHGMIKAGTDFDPDKIAEAYWGAFLEPKEKWVAETIFK